VGHLSGGREGRRPVLPSSHRSPRRTPNGYRGEGSLRALLPGPPPGIGRRTQRELEAAVIAASGSIRSPTADLPPPRGTHRRTVRDRRHSHRQRERGHRSLQEVDPREDHHLEERHPPPAASSISNDSLFLRRSTMASGPGRRSASSPVENDTLRQHDGRAAMAPTGNCSRPPDERLIAGR
jgi:hypothetical protein